MYEFAVMLAHVICCGYIWYARGGSQGWLEIPDWFPARASTGIVIFSAMIFHSASLDLYTLAIIFVLPYIWNLIGQSLGHGSYMDAGYWDRPDTQGLRYLMKPVKYILGSDRSAGYDFIGGLLKGLIMVVPIMWLWVWFFQSLIPLVLFVVALALPVCWFINNRWFKKLQVTSFFGAPVYWAEIFFGLTYGVVINIIGLSV